MSSTVWDQTQLAEGRSRLGRQPDQGKGDSFPKLKAPQVALTLPVSGANLQALGKSGFNPGCCSSG